MIASFSSDLSWLFGLAALVLVVEGHTHQVRRRRARRRALDERIRRTWQR